MLVTPYFGLGSQTVNIGNMVSLRVPGPQPRKKNFRLLLIIGTPMNFKFKGVPILLAPPNMTGSPGPNNMIHSRQHHYGITPLMDIDLRLETKGSWFESSC